MNIRAASGSSYAYIQLGGISFHGHCAQIVAFLILALVVWQVIAHRSKKHGLRAAFFGKRRSISRRR
jgi:hypothetical protein